MHTSSCRILGIDPGSRLTGYGIVDLDGRRVSVVTHGTLLLRRAVNTRESREENASFELRLYRLYQRLSEVIVEFRPTHLAIEKVFFAKNPVSALKLGQARGAALVCAVNHGLLVREYAATEVKSAIVGHGRADKDQVAKMLERILGPQSFATTDSSDALALAVCHAQLSQSVARSVAQSVAALARASRGRRSESAGVSAPRNARDADPNSAAAQAAARQELRRPKRTSRLAESLGIRIEDVVGKKRIRL